MCVCVVDRRSLSVNSLIKSSTSSKVTTKLNISIWREFDLNYNEFGWEGGGREGGAGAGGRDIIINAFECRVLKQD